MYTLYIHLEVFTPPSILLVITTQDMSILIFSHTSGFFCLSGWKIVTKEHLRLKLMPVEDNQFYVRALVLYTVVSLTLKYVYSNYSRAKPEIYCYDRVD